MNNLFSRQLLKSVCFTLMACLVLYSNAEEKEWPREKQLWNQYSIVKGNTELEITKLQDLMKYYFHGVSNMTKGDSVSNLCLRIAYESNKQDHILAAYEAYFKYGASISKKVKNWNYIKTVKSLSPFPSWHVNYFTAAAHFIELDFNHGLSYAKEAIQTSKKEKFSEQYFKS
jgi:hypothetical protein